MLDRALPKVVSEGFHVNFDVLRDVHFEAGPYLVVGFEGDDASKYLGHPRRPQAAIPACLHRDTIVRAMLQSPVQRAQMLQRMPPLLADVLGPEVSEVADQHE